MKHDRASLSNISYGLTESDFYFSVWAIFSVCHNLAIICKMRSYILIDRKLELLILALRVIRCSLPTGTFEKPCILKVITRENGITAVALQF